MRRLPPVLLIFLIAACGESIDPIDAVDENDDPRIENEKTERDATNNKDLDPIDEPDPIEPVIEPCVENEGCFSTFPTRISDTTIGGERTFDQYGCDPTINESGPERLYKVRIEEAGFVAIELVDEALDADIDVHLLSSLDPDACLDRGHMRAGGFVEPGDYWIVADSWTDDQGTEFPGSFELAINVVRAKDWIDMGMDHTMAGDAFTAFTNAWKTETDRFEYAITDFSIHSSQPRQWIVQLATGELLYNLTVGHGEASIEGEDLGYSSVFSNIPESHQSSLGLIRAAEPYVGDYGYSMRLDGLEAGFNDNVRTRDIVVHPWDGNLPTTIALEGWVTPTWGCATITPEISDQVINTISEGSLMFFWYPDPTYRSTSRFLQSYD